ncbi:MAG TPA: sulfatase-like hydrolase/transferase [Chthoniobacterales bacterium]|nr:sulfatase-like hydrolase/transferase [Chthoniobacterales bacterium]
MKTEVTRRRFIRTAALGSVSVALSARLRAQPAKLPRKPNLLVFLPDQLRADTVFGEAANAVHAPAIHKLASQATIFERAYVTQPICAPSRSSLFSGTWPHTNGCTSNQQSLPHKFKCLPEMLADSDYRCGNIGKWHLGDEFSAQRGFEDWVSIEEAFKSALGAKKIDGVSDYTKFLIEKGHKPDHGKYFTRTYSRNLPVDLSKAKFLEIKACEFLERNRERPFIVFVAFIEPHPPYTGPFNDEHPLDSIVVDATNADRFGPDMPLHYRLREEVHRKRYNGDAQRYREIKQKYFGLITEIDHCIGGILSKLDELGLTDKTITVLTSDHGDMMSAHGLLGKRFMFDQSAGVPYVVRMPGQQKSVRVAQPVSHIDFAPTMLDLLGKTPDSQCVGKSRAALVRGESMPADPVFIEWAPGKEKINKQTKLAGKDDVKKALAEHTRAMVSPDGWKLCLRDQDKNELYNLHVDPEERKNLYSDSSQLDTIKRLTDQIHDWQQRTGDSVKV